MAIPSWTDPERWAQLLEGIGCPLCDPRGGPGRVVGELPATLALMDPTVHVRGYCCLVLREHRTELDRLSAGEAAALMHDIRHAAAALRAVTGAIRINFEIHGNVIPHLHVHLIPRYPGDAIERSGKPFAQLTDSPYAEGEFERLVAALHGALAPESRP